MTSSSNLLAGPRSGLGSEVTLMASGKRVKRLKNDSKGLNAVIKEGAGGWRRREEGEIH